MRVAVFLCLATLAACGAGEDTGEAAPSIYEVAERQLTTGRSEVSLGESYRFCHVALVDAVGVLPWCEHPEPLDESVCPGVVETCATPDAASRAVSSVSGCDRGTSAPPGESFSAPEAPAPQSSSDWTLPECGCEAPESAGDWLAAILKLSAALLLALVVGVVLRMIFVAMARREESPSVPAVVVHPVNDVDPSEEVPEVPADDLLGSARRALDSGLMAEAIVLSRLAALRGLHDAGMLRLHRSRTDREYARTLQGEPEVYGAAREIFQAVERLRWGGEERPTESRARAAWQAASRIVQVLAAAALVLLLSAAGLESRFGPGGDAALHEVFTAYGFEASWRLRPLAALDEEVDVLVLNLQQVALREGDAEVLQTWTREGGLLVLAGDATEIFPELGYWDDQTSPPFSVGPGFEGMLQAPWLPGPAAGFGDGALRPMIEEAPGTPEFVLVGGMPVGAGGVLAYGDARLWTNIGLAFAEHRRLVGLAPVMGVEHGLWELDSRPILQIASMNAGAADSPLQSLARADLLPIVLQILLLALAAVAWRGIALRPLRDPPSEGRRDFAQHVRALGHQVYRERGSAHAVGAYARLLLTLRSARALEESARRAGYDEEQATRLIARAREAAAETDRVSHPATDFALMEELWKIDPTR